MFRYPYTATGPTSPPAPFVLLNVGVDETGRWVEDLPALTDTGADQTVLPERVVAQLGLAQLDQVTVTGFSGRPETRPTYGVRLVVRDLPPLAVEVLTGWSDHYAILGRDVLNRYKVLLDGPNLRLEIG
jgi:hypothetical protein